MTDAEARASIPLAEGRWLWRRLYVFVVSLALWRMLASVIDRAPAEAMARIASGLMGLLALTLVLYLVAPTAQQLIALLASLRFRVAAGGGR
ncbi:MAG: hypothetical protein Q8S03_13115 [Brevundimonas sp.]|uniref:hypothetical protein n=1 Tax=Brevundimonas sp. TaxID=1871086 RepID=UPI002735EAFC|nr:hypothetical protein [Brevundimonas sp.]MBX9616954.1 hypothetical protein [Caulobacteraceae bacterium]MDP3405629.1 hypothetical protein [Brevundimonas sp.]